MIGKNYLLDRAYKWFDPYRRGYLFWKLLPALCQCGLFLKLHASKNCGKGIYYNQQLTKGNNLKPKADDASVNYADAK